MPRFMFEGSQPSPMFRFFAHTPLVRPNRLPSQRDSGLGAREDVNPFPNFSVRLVSGRNICQLIRHVCLSVCSNESLCFEDIWYVHVIVVSYGSCKIVLTELL